MGLPREPEVRAQAQELHSLDSARLLHLVTVPSGSCLDHVLCLEVKIMSGSTLELDENEELVNYTSNIFGTVSSKKQVQKG